MTTTVRFTLSGQPAETWVDNPTSPLLYILREYTTGVAVRTERAALRRWSRTVRRLHGSPRQRRDPLLHPPGDVGCGTVRHHVGGDRYRGGPAPGPGRLRGGGRWAVRLLHKRNGDAGTRLAGAGALTLRSGNTRGVGEQPLSLRRARAYGEGRRTPLRRWRVEGRRTNERDYLAPRGARRWRRARRAARRRCATVRVRGTGEH